ncbi:MAG TPA: ATP-grasp domain-containing protein [Acidimicrobiales bacterium]|nr:ATP-grasp domain-containing protein [Acidimicrobiales bacterium]
MPRLVLILPSSTYRAEDFLTAAATLGVEVVVASEHRQTLSAAMGERALVLDPCDPEGAADAVAALAARLPVDAVVAVDDEGVLAAAAAARRLGLPHNPPGAVAATRDKARLRAALAGGGVRQPAYRVVGPGADAGDAGAELGFPVVVKPVGLSASRGVIRADDPAAARDAAARARAIAVSAGRDPAAPLLVEAFVPGPEVAVEALVSDGAVQPLVVFDKPDPLDGPYFEETIYVAPSRLEPEALTSIEEVVGDAVAALGLRHGVVHAELRVPAGRAHLIEVAARSIGGLCSRALRFGTGRSLEELVLGNALGLPLAGTDRREEAAAGVMMIPIPAEGRLVAVGGVEAARAVPLVTDVQITIPAGGRVVPLPEGDRYLGFVFARGGEAASVEAALRAAHQRLQIEIAPAGETVAVR